ncbi:OB-fold domain-containing protein [Amycolatopsis sp. NPDC006131]|uniref:OB-fold domain-containing protein n=1 Tax=Amycolatopsis sp. NPDC006131 TaxID=3156731 RepID=UPI0033BBE078
MTGIRCYGTYLPAHRLARADIAAAVGESATGTRVVAGPDEDSTTLAVAAGHAALGGSRDVDAVWFATTAPAYADKTNAVTAHAALGLPDAVGAFDLGATVRSGAAALLAASRGPGLALLSDVREGHTGGTEERTSGDGAAAFVFGEHDLLADLVGTTSVSAEFLDRWRRPGDTGSRGWEERFGEGEYSRLAEQAFTDLLKRTGIAATDLSAVAVSGPNARAVRTTGRWLQRQTGALEPGTDLAAAVGNTGAAHTGLVLADMLDQARPGDTLLLMSLADGADAFLFRATDRIVTGRPRPLRDGLASGKIVPYATYLLWRGRVEREPARRPEPVRPSAPFAARNAAFKFGFAGGRCRSCGTVQFPGPRVCLRCRAIDGFEPVPVAGQCGRIVTFTVDHLAYSPNPPTISAVVDLDAGGRVQIELTDCEPGEIAVGDAVELTFRRLGTVEGIHNYFWKARPR